VTAQLSRELFLNPSISVVNRGNRAAEAIHLPIQVAPQRSELGSRLLVRAVGCFSHTCLLVGNRNAEQYCGCEEKKTTQLAHGIMCGSWWWWLALRYTWTEIAFHYLGFSGGRTFTHARIVRLSSSSPHALPAKWQYWLNLLPKHGEQGFCQHGRD
jgi:hypothetical protein